ncbi:MAG: aminodeoxychorismate/anthranilate synthase component II [Bacillota bacterium]
MIMVLDNYDSFTYNLVQILGTLGTSLEVIRNDRIEVADVRAKAPEGILISPGPGTPQTAGISIDLIRELGHNTPIMGVCLGHQAIGEAYGGKITSAPVLMHGKTSSISHDGMTLFRDLPNPLVATRYHSLIIDETTMPTDLSVSARDDAGIIMGVRHAEYPVEGVQFHPESILTPQGPRMLENFLVSVKKWARTGTWE